MPDPAPPESARVCFGLPTYGGKLRFLRIFRFTRDITRSTMDRQRLDKLRDELEAMRGVPQKAADVAGLAERLGRKRMKGRGRGEPTWVSDFDIPNLSIPMHPGDLKKGTQKSILIQLEDDLLAWEDKLEREKVYQEQLKIERQKRGLE
jgi:hypothetical protein